MAFQGKKKTLHNGSYENSFWESYMVVDVLVHNPQKSNVYESEKKHVRRDSKMCCCCCWCRYCSGAPTIDERIHAPVLHDESQTAYCRYWGHASLPPIKESSVTPDSTLSSWFVNERWNFQLLLPPSATIHAISEVHNFSEYHNSVPIVQSYNGGVYDGLLAVVIMVFLKGKHVQAMRDAVGTNTIPKRT